MNEGEDENGGDESADRAPLPPPEPPPALPEAVEGDPLAQVVDDEDAYRDVAEWADGELLKERTPEELIEALVGTGWEGDKAAELVEASRVRTRAARGVLTREDVAREMRSRYGKGMRVSWFAGWPTISSAWRLMVSIGAVLTLRRWRNRGG